MTKMGIYTVLIGGGSGFMGSYLTRALKIKGYNVKIISRKPGPMSISWIELSHKGLPECTAVVNVAGQNMFDIKRRWTPGFKQNVESSRINTTATLAKLISEAKEKPDVFISMSGVGYYKPDAEAEYTESSPGGDFDFLSKLASKWEEASTLPQDCNVRKVIVRSGVVLGRGGGMIEQLYWPFFFGGGGPVGDGKQFFPWIHINDIVGLMLHCIENKSVSGILNGVAPHIITNKDFATAFGRALWRPAFIPVPTFILNAAFSEERAKIMTEGQKVIPKRTLETGYKFLYPDISSACKQLAPLVYLDDHMIEEAQGGAPKSQKESR